MRTIIALLATSIMASAQIDTIWPETNRVPWTPGIYTGVPGGIPVVTNVWTNFYSTNASSEVQAAINTAPAGTFSVIKLNAGVYYFTNGLQAGGGKSHIIFRGDGTNTIINTTNAAGFLYAGSASDYDWRYPSATNWITGGLSKGSTNLSLANTTDFATGRLARIIVVSDTNIPVTGVTGTADGLQQQAVWITAKTSSNVTIWPPLYGGYGAARLALARQQATWIGVEDMVINATNSTAQHPFYWEQTYACWMKGVRVRYSYNYNVFWYDSAFVEMRECYLDRVRGSGPNHSGLLVNTVSAGLFEDNIIYGSFPLIENNFGISGNVFGYNFCEDSRDGGVGALGAAIDSNHAPHNAFNLYEGNVSPNIQCDGYYGSASHDTIFRNWFHGSLLSETPAYVLGNRYAVIFNRFTRYMGVIGNVLGNTNSTWAYGGLACAYPGGTYDGILYKFGYPNLGNDSSVGYAPPWADWGTWPGANGFQECDTNVAATTTLKGNWSYYASGVTNTESLGGVTLPDSLYRDSKPSYFGTNRWPTFGPEQSTTLASIPAQYRYFGVAQGGGDTPATPRRKFKGISIKRQ
jgi:hypothetical protein